MHFSGLHNFGIQAGRIGNLFREIWTYYGLASGNTSVANLAEVLDNLIHRSSRYEFEEMSQYNVKLTKKITSQSSNYK